jgi:hypothetical protein
MPCPARCGDILSGSSERLSSLCHDRVTMIERRLLDILALPQSLVYQECSSLLAGVWLWLWLWGIVFELQSRHVSIQSLMC